MSLIICVAYPYPKRDSRHFSVACSFRLSTYHNSNQGLFLTSLIQVSIWKGSCSRSTVKLEWSNIVPRFSFFKVFTKLYLASGLDRYSLLWTFSDPERPKTAKCLPDVKKLYNSRSLWVIQSKFLSFVLILIQSKLQAGIYNLLRIMGCYGIWFWS